MEDYAGPFERICYLGSGFDTTPAKTLQGQVDHVDHDPEAVEFMRRQGYSAFQEEVEEFDPRKTYNLVIISHLPSGNPLLEPNLAEDGIVACRFDGRARKLDERNNLDLQAAYEDSRQMVEKDDLEDAEEARIYLFSKKNLSSLLFNALLIVEVFTAIETYREERSIALEAHPASAFRTEKFT